MRKRNFLEENAVQLVWLYRIFTASTLGVNGTKREKVVLFRGSVLDSTIFFI